LIEDNVSAIKGRQEWPTLAYWRSAYTRALPAVPEASGGRFGSAPQMTASPAAIFFTMADKHEKRRAREAVKRAVKSGRLVRPKACEGCGYALPVAAHHPDYTKPLDVEWLCVDCHAGRHDEAQDMELGSFLFAFRQSEIAQARYEDDRAYFDWRNWPPN
jgi:hypothetical protein